MEECMAALGGQGYMEETGIGRLIRDSMVEKIWEGTITVLSLDLFRAAADERNLAAFLKWARAIIKSCPSALRTRISAELQELEKVLNELPGVFKSSCPPLAPRPALILFSIATAALNLLEHAVWSHTRRESESDHEVDIEVFSRWIAERGLTNALRDAQKATEAGRLRLHSDEAIVYGVRDAKSKARL